MEAVVENDNGRAAGGGAGDLDRVLDRLGARVDEERLLLGAAHGCRRVLGEPATDLDVRLVGADHEALVQEAVDLLVDRGDDRRVAVAGVLAGDPAGEVEVERAVGGLHLRSDRAGDDELRCRDPARDVAGARLEDVVDRVLPERHRAILSRRGARAQWTARRALPNALRHGVVSSRS